MRRNDDVAVLQQLHPTEVVKLTARVPTSLVVRPLPSPAPVPLHPGETISVTMSAVADGDPRGPFADAQFTLAQPSSVVLQIHPDHQGPDHSGVHYPTAALFGPHGKITPQSTTVIDPALGSREQVWLLPSGTFLVRLQPSRLGAQELHCASAPSDEPEWCDQPEDSLPFPTRLTLETTSTATAPPAPLHVSEKPPKAGTLLNEAPITIEVAPPPIDPNVVINHEGFTCAVRSTVRCGNNTLECEDPAAEPLSTARLDPSEPGLLTRPSNTHEKSAKPHPELPREPSLELGHWLQISPRSVRKHDAHWQVVVAVTIPKPGPYLISHQGKAREEDVAFTVLANEHGCEQRHYGGILGDCTTTQAVTFEAPGTYRIRVDAPSRTVSAELQITPADTLD